jgi:hypothetical protein
MYSLVAGSKFQRKSHLSIIDYQRPSAISHTQFWIQEGDRYKQNMTTDQAVHQTQHSNTDEPQAEPSENGDAKIQEEGTNMDTIPNSEEPHSSNAGQEEDLNRLEQLNAGNDDPPAAYLQGQDRAESQGSYALSAESTTDVIGSAHIRPIFLGNLDLRVTAEEISDIFTRPALDVPPMPVERVDLKRGFAFVFLKDAKTQEDKERVQRYIDGIQGLYVSFIHLLYRFVLLFVQRLSPVFA